MQCHTRETFRKALRFRDVRFEGELVILGLRVLSEPFRYMDLTTIAGNVKIV